MRILCVILVVAGVLHILWESAHIGLYQDYEAMTGGLPVLLLATLGDVAYSAGAILLVLWIEKSPRILREFRIRDAVTYAVLGFLIALFVEYKALALGRWAYTDAMPIVPILGVGLSPLVQMTVLLPLSVALGVLCMRMAGTPRK